jgi:hypothetical protein
MARVAEVTFQASPSAVETALLIGASAVAYVSTHSTADFLLWMLEGDDMPAEAKHGMGQWLSQMPPGALARISEILAGAVSTH